MFIFAIFTLLLAGAAVSMLLWSIVLPRARAASRLRDINEYGFTGLKSKISPQSASSHGSSGLFGQLAQAIGNFLSKWVGTVRETKMRKELRTAGIYKLSPRVLVGYRALAAVTLGVLVLVSDVTDSPLQHIALAIGCGWLGWIMPLVIVRRKGRERLATIDRTLPDLIDLLVVTIEAGLSFGSSMKLASERMEGPLGDELRLTLKEHEMGLSLNDALKGLVERVTTPSTQSFSRSIIQGQTLGVSIGTIMRNLATEMRLKRRQMAEELAQKAPTKMLFPLIFMIFPAMGIVLLGPAIFEIMRGLGS